jgi:hypothetical protein
MDLQQVGDSFVRPAYTPNELVAIIGERIAENVLKSQGHVVFSDWKKHVSGTGFDMVSYNPATGELWIIDNKAQFRGIGGANALTGTAYVKYEADLRNFLKTGWQVKAEADLALAALDAKKFKLVASNGFAGEATRFTKGLFDQGLHAFDVRVARLFTNHADWVAAYTVLTLRKGLRLTGQRAMMLEGGNLAAAAVALGAGMFLLTGGMSLTQVAVDLVAQFAGDVLLSRLPGGGAAAFVIGLPSDETSAQRQNRILNEQIDVIMSRIPGVETLSATEEAESRKAARQILSDPIIIEDPTVDDQPPQYLLPGLKRNYLRPSTTDA